MPEGNASTFYGRRVDRGPSAPLLAIRRVDPSWVTANGGSRAFLERARPVTTLRHRNIVPLIDAVLGTGETFLVMEYVPGETLDRLLAPLASRGERVPPRIACALVAGVLRGLSAAHEATSADGEPLAILHGDVSPQNVLVGADGVARLLDFGCPRPSEPYAAPEQAAGAPSPKSDVFSAAILLWEALTGRSALGEVNHDAGHKGVEGSRASVLDAPSKLVLGIPREVDVITLKALRCDPAERYASATEMARDLEACIGEITNDELAAWVDKCARFELERRAAMVSAIELGGEAHGASPDEGSPGVDALPRFPIAALGEPDPSPPRAVPVSVAPPQQRPPGGTTARGRGDPAQPMPTGQLLAYAFIGFAVVTVLGVLLLLARASYLGIEHTKSGSPPAGDASTE